MDTYLTIMVTVLVATQVIRIAQNTIQLHRLDWAMRQIAEYLQRERDELEELRQIDKFCGISKGV